jgi:hypothetical protein
MPQNFFFPQRDQTLVMPADMCEWLPEDDLVFVVLVDCLIYRGLPRSQRRRRHVIKP